MNNLIWKYADSLPEANELDVIEVQYGFCIPKDLKTCLTVNNGGMPNKTRVPLKDGGEVVFGYLISFSSEEVEDFYDILESFGLCSNGQLSVFPFACDPTGNLFCAGDNGIVFLDHETDEMFRICDTFTQLLEKLVD